jgi:hypothetical protein
MEGYQKWIGGQNRMKKLVFVIQVDTFHLAEDAVRASLFRWRYELLRDAADSKGKTQTKIKIDEVKTQ